MDRFLGGIGSTLNDHLSDETTAPILRQTNTVAKRSADAIVAEKLAATARIDDEVCALSAQAMGDALNGKR